MASYLPVLDHVAASIGGLPTRAETGRLYRGDGQGGFEDVTTKVGLDEVAVVMGCNFGDLDGDGYLDFYLGTGYPGYEALMPNKMYRNRAGAGFADVTTAGGFGHVQKGHGVAFADLDGDGDQDVFIETGGAFPGDAFRNVYFQNPGFGTHWITVRLTGVESNRSAIGARIRCQVRAGERLRSIYKYVNGGGSFGRNPLRQMIGLGDAERIEVLEVFWPTTGATQVFEGVAVDQAIHIVEGEGEFSRD